VQYNKAHLVLHWIRSGIPLDFGKCRIAHGKWIEAEGDERLLGYVFGFCGASVAIDFQRRNFASRLGAQTPDIR
jgi:hypothetical protein